MIPSISVVIPCFNAERFITEALSSVAAQTCRPQEIVVVNDASTDRTAPRVEEFARTSPVPLKLRRRARNSGGPAAPLNEGIAAATGSLIALCEHDDLMLPERLEQQARCLALAPTCSLATCFAILENRESNPPRIQETTMDLGVLRAEHLRDAFYASPGKAVYRSLLTSRRWFLRSLSGCLFTKELWEHLGGFDEAFRVSADADFIYRALALSDLAIVARPLYRYRLFEQHLYRKHALRGMREYASVLVKQLSQGPPVARSDLRRRLRRELFDLGYECRSHGRTLDALLAYVSYVRHGGSLVPAARAMMGALLDAIPWKPRETDGTLTPSLTAPAHPH